MRSATMTVEEQLAVYRNLSRSRWDAVCRLERVIAENTKLFDEKRRAWHDRIEELHQRIAELEAELERLHATPMPVREVHHHHYHAGNDPDHEPVEPFIRYPDELQAMNAYMDALEDDDHER